MLETIKIVILLKPNGNPICLRSVERTPKKEKGKMSKTSHDAHKGRNDRKGTYENPREGLYL